jgi:hypothetical protein
MPTVDYLPLATGGGAIVDSQGAFAGSGYQTNGQGVGITVPAQVNKMWRQSSVVAAALANYISTALAVDVLDDGNVAALTAKMVTAFRVAAGGLVSVAYSNTAIFDGLAGTIFEVTLTGDMLLPTFINVVQGARYTFIIHQDGAGGHAFTPPANLPADPISLVLSTTNVQSFVTGSGAFVYPASPMLVLGLP